MIGSVGSIALKSALLDLELKSVAVPLAVVLRIKVFITLLPEILEISRYHEIIPKIKSATRIKLMARFH